MVAGRLPREDARDELALSPKVAKRFGVHVGDTIEYRFEATRSKRVADTTFRIVGIVRLPPVIVDENDIIEGAVLKLAATGAHLDALVYSWQGIRLVDGVHGITRFLETLRTNGTVDSLPAVIQRYDETRVQAQRSIRPEAVALALFGVAAAVAALALGGLATGRLSRRWSAGSVWRCARWNARIANDALVFGLDGALAVTLGMGFAIVLTVLLSPLSPIGIVREIAPGRSFHADLTVLLGAGGALASALFAISAVWAWRGANDQNAIDVATTIVGCRRPGDWARSIAAGVLGAHFALDRDNERSVPTRATLVAGGTATIAVVAALVFGASLQSLVTNPSRYGWNWDRLLIAEAGYGNLEPRLTEHLHRPRTDNHRAGPSWRFGRSTSTVFPFRRSASTDARAPSNRRYAAAGPWRTTMKSCSERSLSINSGAASATMCRSRREVAPTCSRSSGLSSSRRSGSVAPTTRRSAGARLACMPRWPSWPHRVPRVSTTKRRSAHKLWHST